MLKALKNFINFIINIIIINFHLNDEYVNLLLLNWHNRM